MLLASPVFCRHFGSGGEPEGLHSIGVLSFDDEFREAVARGGIQEKFRHAVAQGIGHDQLGGRDARPDGAQPGAEGGPDALREGDGQVLKQSLTDDSRLDEDVVACSLRLTASRYSGDARWRCWLPLRRRSGFMSDIQK